MINNSRQMKQAELISEEVVYEGFITVRKLLLKHTLFQGGWSDPVTREVAMCANSQVVAVLLFDPLKEKVLLVEQFRPGVFAANEPAWVIEVVAGRVDNGEEPEEAARREIREETGCEVSTLLPIVNYYPSTGACNEKVLLYCGLFSSEGTDSRLCGVTEETENIRTCLIDMADIFQQLEAGKINNATTLIALQWLKLHHSSLKKR